MPPTPDTEKLDRVVLTTQPESTPGRLARMRDALSFGSGGGVGNQQTETRVESGTFGFLSRGVPTVQPAEGVDEYYEVYSSTAIVFTSLWNFASDVWEPGYRIESENDDAVEWLESEWLPQAAVLYGGKRNDFLPFGKNTTIQRWARGGALIEHIRDDPTDATSLVTGLNFIPPETVSFVPYEHKPMLIDPDPEGPLAEEVPEGLDETRRGELPAYIQYHNDAAVSTKNDPIPLSQNDVTRTVFNGDAAGIGSDLDQFWGTPVTAIVAEDVAGFKNILRDKEVAIKNKAYGLWEIAFGRDVFEFHEVDETTGERITVEKIIEFGEEERTEITDEIENEMGPGSILAHDGVTDLNRIEGEVPNLINDLEFYVSNIVSALPTPLYLVGFETSINQFVVEGQSDRYQQLIRWEREELERTFTRIIRGVIETHDSLEADDLEFKIEPATSESPVLSMSDDDLNRLERWADAFDKLRGDLPVDMFVDPDVLRELILQLPEDAAPDLSELDIDDDLAPIFDFEDTDDDGGFGVPDNSSPLDD